MPHHLPILPDRFAPCVGAYSTVDAYVHDMVLTRIPQFSRDVKRDLDTLARSPDSPPEDTLRARLLLARWHRQLFHGRNAGMDYERATELLYHHSDRFHPAPQTFAFIHDHAAESYLMDALHEDAAYQYLKKVNVLLRDPHASAEDITIAFDRVVHHSQMAGFNIFGQPWPARVKMQYERRFPS